MSIRTDIINILRNQICQHINFKIYSIIIKGEDYNTIAKCVENGHIQVIKTSVDIGKKAIYDRKYNCFIIGSNQKANIIVHEATHAINDWYKSRAITVIQDETSAYVAGCMYVLLEHPQQLQAFKNYVNNNLNQNASKCISLSQVCTPQAIRQKQAIVQHAINVGNPNIQQVNEAIQFVVKCIKNDYPNSCSDALIQQATLIAIDILTNKPVNANDLNKLHELLRADPIYKDKVGSATNPKSAQVNGILRVQIPQAFLNQIHGTIIQN